MGTSCHEQVQDRTCHSHNHDLTELRMLSWGESGGEGEV